MSIYVFIPVIFIGLYAAYYMYTKRKYAELAGTVANTDFKAEFEKAAQYRDEFLEDELPYVKKAMGDAPIDAYTYGNADYGFGDALKDGLKNKLKEVATLGTVRFNTVVTPKYLVLSGDELHLLDTDTDGEIDRHIVFTPDQLQNARLNTYPMQGQIKAQAEARTKNVKAYMLSLPGDKGKQIGFIIYSCLIFTEIPEIPNDPKRTIKTIIIGNDFLKQLGDKYPRLKVSLPIFN